MPRFIGLNPFTRFSSAGLFLSAFFCVVTAATGEAAGDARVTLFNLNPSRTYTVFKNANLLTSSNSSPEGAAGFNDQANSGDYYEIVETGSSPTAPSAPSGVAAAGSDVGCAQVSWNLNPESDIHSYRVYYGASSVEGGTASSYDDSVLAGDVTSVSVCGLDEATYFFAVRACNAAGLLSALSPEVSASVSNGSAQPPLPPLMVTASAGAPGCVDVAWIPNGSPDVVGYLVDYGPVSVEGGGAPDYANSVEVGNVSSYHLHDLPAGMCYVAVRAKNNLGLVSGYSAEQSAEVLETAVFITAFGAEAGPDNVVLSWRVTADEAIQGYNVYRRRDGEAEAVRLNGGALIPPELDGYVDKNTEPETIYYYTLFVTGEYGEEYRSATVSVKTSALVFALGQNFPNPFNPATTITFTVPASEKVRLAVYDVRGALVKTLLDETLPAGTHVVRWDGTNSSGGVTGSGQYFYRLSAGSKTKTRKMLLLK